MEQYDVNDFFKKHWGTGNELFRHAFSVEGHVFRNIKNRCTLKFCLDGKSFFIKRQGPVGWREILKNKLQGKDPVVSSANEYLALRLLPKLGVHTMTSCAFAVRGNDIAHLESFLVTEELIGMVSLEDYCRYWKDNPPSPRVRRSIVRALAETCAKMHRSGMNHRDCYLCHFLVDPQLLERGKCDLFVIDLHRAQIRNHIPKHFQIKDVAGIFFSSMDCGLTKRDILRFMAVYTHTMRTAIPRQTWNRIFHAAVRLYRKEHNGNAPELPAGISS